MSRNVLWCVLLVSAGVGACSKQAPDSEAARSEVNPAQPASAALKSPVPEPGSNGAAEDTLTPKFAPPPPDVKGPGSPAPKGAGVERDWLKRAREGHAAADTALQNNNVDAALSSLEDSLKQVQQRSAVGAAAPGAAALGAAAVDDVWVQLDLLARLADLELQRGQPAQALERAKQGLALSTEPSVPLATLHVVRGRAFEQLDDKVSAAAAYHAALVINQTLMDRALSDPAAQTP